MSSRVLTTKEAAAPCIAPRRDATPNMRAAETARSRLHGAVLNSREIKDVDAIDGLTSDNSREESILRRNYADG